MSIDVRAPERHGLLVGTIFLLQFLVALDMSLVNIALPAIREDLGFSPTGLQWVVNAYLLCLAGFMLVGGRLGDLWGRRVVVIGGLIVFAGASIAGGFASSAGVLVAARTVQGLAAALLAPAALALASTITDTARRNRAIGVWGAAGAAGGAVGVVASGLLTQWWDWRAVLFVNVPIVAVALLTAFLGIPGTTRVHGRSPDIAGAVAVTGGIATLVWAVTSTGEHGWVSAQVIGGTLSAAVLLAVFAALERRSDHPMMPIRVLATRSIVGANVFGFMLTAGQLAAFYFCSLYVQTVWHVEPDVAGLLFLPFCVFIVLGIIAAGRLAKKIGARATIAAFGLLGALGLAAFSRMPAEFDFWLGILVPSLLTAVGIGGSMMLVGMAGTSGVAPADAGVASGVLNSSRQLGGTIGLAVLVTVAAHHDGLRAGYQAGLLVGAVLLAVGSVAAWLILPRSATPDTQF